MKRFLWASPILLVVISASAFATSTTIFLSPNDGSGDNFGFSQGGDLGLGGGTPFRFFNIFGGYAPGSTFGGATSVFLGGGFIQIGSTTYDLDFTGPGGLFISPFTFPSNGQSFSIQVLAGFSAQALIFVNGQPQLLNISGSAPGEMQFTWDPSSGLFFGNSVVFTTAPEPGTLGLMATGLIGLLGAVGRKLRIKAAAGA